MKMSVIIPTVEKYVVQTADGAVILETTDMAQAQAMIAGTNNILQYIFKEIEPDATIH